MSELPLVGFEPAISSLHGQCSINVATKAAHFGWTNADSDIAYVPTKWDMRENTLTQYEESNRCNCYH